ncbi:MAG: hypothetical protein ACI8X5_002448 [Planctomycetota bacterium]
MAEFYLASLALTCDQRSTSLQREFAKRWKRRLERSWAKIPLGTATPIEDALNGKVWLACGDDIRTDTPGLSMSIDGLKAGAWKVAPDGSYFQSTQIRVQTALGGDPVPWTFRATDGSEGGVSLYATFNLVSY